MKNLFLLSFLFLLQTSARAQIITLKGQSISTGEVDDFIQEKMKHYKIPGLSIAIINNGQVVYNRAFGVGNTAQGKAIDSNAIFEAASLSKPIFAFAFAKLVDQGKIALDTPLYKYLEYDDIKYDDRYKLITARMVLSHTSGFPNWRENNKDGKLNIKFTPGERFSYSGEGYEYLSHVVKKITGEDSEDYIRQTVFVPLGMTHSYYKWNSVMDSMAVTGHDRSEVPHKKWKPKETSVASGLHTTAVDYVHFLQAVIQHNGVSEQTLNEMEKPQVKVTDRAIHADTWGLGFGIKDTPEGTVINHFGADPYFECYMEILKGGKTGMVYFTNCKGGLKIMKQLRKKLIVGKAA